ncbi:oxidoreductase [Lentzea aerocolonigenes]|uniref:oxidoreductase n=1 Tax=Lentzea aerocolonigenes TaxID=68170 RepID=UPI0004C33B6F|nr:FAD-dependent oxidoreductase [Lentzea aerocolonigenes]
MLPRVFQPGTIGRMRLPNRIVMGSMHLNLETCDDGGAAVAAFYAERARGGAGLIVTGGCAVNRQGSGGRGYVVLTDRARHDALARWADAVHAEGGRIALQLFHAGRLTSSRYTGLPPAGPSTVASRMFPDEPPIAMTAGQIEDTIADFARAAVVAGELGFDAVEVMGSEGYLVNQFGSPLTNTRTDEWGGDARRRNRFAVAVVSAIRDSAPALPVLFRMSGDDLMPGSSTVDEQRSLAVELALAGVHALNVGVGWHESRIPTVQSLVPHGAWSHYAAGVKLALAAERLTVPVITANRFTRLAQAEQALADGQADFVSMARPLLADPAIVTKTRTGAPVNICIACNEACIDRSLGEEPVSCVVNPRAGRELVFRQVRVRKARQYAVIGGGPAGMEAARALRSLGHDVDLFEASGELGGQFRLARLVPGKADFGATIGYFTDELARLGVRVRLTTPITADNLELIRQADGVVLATGVTPRELDLPGANLPHVVHYQRAFLEPESLGRRVVIIGGGGIAVDLAHLLGHGPSPLDARTRFLAEHGLAEGPPPAPSPRSLTILRRRGRIGAGMGRSTRWAAVDALRRQGTVLLSGVQYEAITPCGVQITDNAGTRREIPADSVVVAIGQEPRADLLPLLARTGVPHQVIGGSSGATGLNATRAFEEGLRAAYVLGR